MKGKSSWIVASIVIMSMVLAGCAGSAQPETPSVTYPEMEGTAPIKVKGPLLLDSAIVEVGNEASETIAEWIYEPLVRNLDGNIIGGLARSWQQSEDGLEYTFTLRPNAVFQDGTPISTDIVIANFNRWFEPKNALHGSNDLYHAWADNFFGFNGEVDTNKNPVSIFDGIEKVDPLTFLIHLNRPMPEILYTLALPQFSILNPADLVKAGANYGTSMETTNASGPYILSKWDAATIELTPNKDYFGTLPTSDLVFEITQ